MGRGLVAEGGVFAVMAVVGFDEVEDLDLGVGVVSEGPSLEHLVLQGSDERLAPSVVVGIGAGGHALKYTRVGEHPAVCAAAILAAAVDRRLFKGIRFAILKNRKNRTMREHKLLKELARTHRQIHRACTLKDEINHFWEYSNVGLAEKFLKRWCKSAKLSRMEPLRKFAETMQRHWEPMIASLTGVTNAAAEGINRLIRMARNRASGYRNPNNLANMIYVIAGDLDIPAQITPENRTRQTTIHTHKQLASS